MADDVSVRFGADASGIQAGADQAGRAVADFATRARADSAAVSAEMARLNARIAELSASLRSTAAQSQATAAYDALGLGIGRVSAAQTVLGDAAASAQRSLGTAVSATMASMDGEAHAAAGVATSIAAWVFNALSARDTLPIVAARTDDLTRALGGGATAWDTYWHSVAIAQSNLAQIEGRAIAVAGNMDKVAATAAAAGESASTYMRGLTVELTKIPGLSDEGAAAIEAMLGAIPNYSTAANEALITILRMLSANGEEAQKLAQQLSAAFANPAANGDAFLNTLGGVSEKLREQFATARQSLDVNRMQGTLYEALIQRARAMGEEQLRPLKEQLKTMGELGPLGRILAVGLHGQVDAAVKFNDELDRTLEKLEAERRSLASAALSGQQLGAALQGVLQASNPTATQLDAVNARIGVLRQGLQSATGDASALIRQFEGFDQKAKVDTDGHYRAGFGSDTTTDASGQVRAVTSSTVTTMEDALRDLARRVPEFTAVAAQDVGAQFTKLSAQAQASLTSVAYNYGRVPADIAAAARSGNEAALASAIRGRAGDNGGINAGRREAEASNITDAVSAADVGKVNEALRTQADLRQQILDKQAGGSTIEQTGRAIAEHNAAGARDAVKEQQDVNAALERQIALTSDLGAKGALQERLAQGRASLAEKQVAVAKAAADREAADYETGEQKKADILNAALKREQNLYASGTAEYLRLQGQIEANDEAVRKAGQDRAQEAEDQKFRIALNGVTERMALVRQEASDAEISRQAEAAQLLALAARKTAIERAHYDALKSIWDEGTSKYREAVQQMALIDSKSAIERQKIVSETNRAIYADYKSTFEGVASNVSGEIGSLIKGQTTFRQAVGNVAFSMLQDFIAARLRMVADWAAGQAAQVAATHAAEVAKTAAVTGGVAARTAAEETGSAASMASTAGTVLKSIAASASETFAGIFGFLSPVMGPAAVGPATAGQATVAAVASSVPSFAVGAWNLPSDMLAQVHKGEMIVPAGPAAALRGASGASGPTSVTMHHTTQVNVSAVDGQSVASFFANNSKLLMRAINDAVRKGTHLGLSALRP